MWSNVTTKTTAKTELQSPQLFSSSVWLLDLSLSLNTHEEILTYNSISPQVYICNFLYIETFAFEECLKPIKYIKDIKCIMRGEQKGKRCSFFLG